MKLTPEQQSVFRYVYKYVKRDKQCLLVVSGCAGTGKSTLIHGIKQLMSTMILINIVAPTGKAALNVNGVTIHAHFKLPFDAHALAKIAHEPVIARGNQPKRLLIIDEISMVGKRLFQVIDKRLQIQQGNEEPFGGSHVICFGDVHQLQPVGDDPTYNSYLWALFKFTKLVEIQRQKDVVFAAALLHYIQGKNSPSELELLKSRCRDPDNVPSDDEMIHLYFRNTDVDEKNNNVLSKLPNGIICHPQDDILRKPNDAEWTRRPDNIILVEGCRYMVLSNNNMLGIVNGSMCTLKYILSKQDLDKFNEGDFDETARDIPKSSEEIAALIIAIQDTDKIVVLHRDMTYYFDTSIKKSICRTSFPITPAIALTVHKSQGSTYSKVCVYSEEMDRQLFYVAISRCKTIENLYIIGDVVKGYYDYDGIEKLVS